MTRNDIKTKYNFIGENKDMMLFRKRGEFTYGIGYCGNITLKNGKAIFNGYLYLTDYHDYSKTTSKYATEWTGYTTAERRAGLKSDKFTLIVEDNLL